MTSARLTFGFRFLLIALGTVIFAGCSADAKKAKRLAQADTYFKAGEYDKAEIEYKNVIQLAGPDPTAIGRLGIIYFDQVRITQRTGAFLNRAAELQPDNLDVRIKLGYFFLTVGRFGDARDAAIAILERDPKHEVAPFLLAESTNQPKDAPAIRARLQALPSSASTQAALAVLDLRERKIPAGIARLEEALKLAPKQVQALLTLGQAYWAQKNLDQAEKMFAAAAEASKPRSPARTQYAQFLDQTGKAAKAKVVLDEMLKATPDYLPGYIVKASMLLADKDPDGAVSLLQSALEREPQHLEAMMLLAQAWRTKGEYDKALASLQKALAVFPQLHVLHYEVGNIHLAKADLASAATSFSEAIKLSPEYQPAIFALAQTNIRQRNPGPAIVALRALIAKNAANNDARLLLADAYRAQGNFDDAAGIYRQFAEAVPNNAQFHFLLGSVLGQQSRKQDAAKSLSKALELAPDMIAALELLVSIDVIDKNYAAAQARIDRFIAGNPRNAFAHVILARLHLQRPDHAKAEAALQKALEFQPDLPVAIQLLAQLYVSTQQAEKAIASLKAALAKDPKNTGALMQLGILQEQSKDFAGARESYERVLAINPKLPDPLNNLAYLLGDHFKEWDKAQDAAQRARDLLPTHGETADTLGWILLQKRQYTRALTLLEEGAEKLPTNADAQFHVGLAYYLLGREADARTAMERALKLDRNFAGAAEARSALEILTLDVSAKKGAAKPALEAALAKRNDDPVALGKLAAVHEMEGSADKALAAYETILKGNPSHVPAALNAIRLYRARNENAKALDLARATRQLAPTDGQIAHVLGRLAFDAGERQWSVGVLQEAARRLEGNPEVQFDLAEAAYSIGQLTVTESALREAVQVTSFKRASQARQMLELMELAQNPDKAASATPIIEAALKANPASVPALMAQATAAEKKGDAKASRASYEKALSHAPDFTPAKRALAILLADQPEEEKRALEFAMKARESYTNDADLAKALGVILYRQGNFPRAASLLQESARTRSTDAEVMYYLGMAQRQQKDLAAGNRSLQRAIDLGLSGALAAEARRLIALPSK